MSKEKKTLTLTQIRQYCLTVLFDSTVFCCQTSQSIYEIYEKLQRVLCNMLWGSLLYLHTQSCEIFLITCE